MLTACSRPSAWSYSYDLNLNRICEEALQKTIKSDCSETEAQDKSISIFYADEELEDDFIFQGCSEIDNLDGIDRFRGSVTEASNSNNLVGTQISKPANNLELATVNETKYCVDNLKCLRLSDVQKQGSRSTKIVKSSPAEMGTSVETTQSKNEKTGPQKQANRKKEKIGHQKQATSTDYIEQLIQTDAPSFFQKFEQLQIEHYSEKMKWRKKVGFLEQRISLLKSELHEVKRAYGKATEKLNNLKTFWSLNQFVVGRNFDTDLDTQIISVVSEKPTLSQQKIAVQKERTDVKLACYRTNHPEMKRIIVVKENKINEKKFLKVEKTLCIAGPLSLKQTFIQKPLPSKNKLQNSKNKLLPNDNKKLKLGNTVFVKKFDIKTRSLNEAVSLSVKHKALLPLMRKSPGEQHLLLKTTNCMDNKNSRRESCFSLSKERKSDWRRKALGNDRKSISSTRKSSGVSLKVPRLNQSLWQLKQKMSPKTEFPVENPTNTLNERLVKDGKTETFFASHKISHQSTSRSLKHIGESETSSTGITIRSLWL